MSRLPAVEMVRGDTRIIQVVVREKTTKQVVDITGATVLSQIRASADDASVLVTGTGSLPDAANGVLRVTFAAADMEALVAPCVFDIEITFSGGEVKTLWPNRKIKVVNDVSK